MSKLHIYMHGGKLVDGDGVIDKTQTFTVTLAKSVPSLSKGKTCEIRQGQEMSGTTCDCKSVIGKIATFAVSPSQAQVVQRFAAAQQDLATFYAALAAVAKSVQIIIDDGDLGDLKKNDYALCFAKKVGSSGGDPIYNVVWQSLTNYLHSTTFSWTPQFSLFGTNSFSENVQVRADTESQPIGLGEQCVLDESGVLQPASSGGPSTAVTMVNDFGSIHPGLSQMSTLAGQTVVTPLYVAPEIAVKGQVTLTPIESVLVWFEQKIETSTMFSTARSNSVEIDLTNVDSAVRLYKAQAWTTPPPS